MPTADPISRDPALEAQAFWFRFRKEILTAILILVLGALGWGAYRLYVVRQESAAATQLASSRNAADYEQVIQQYGNTPAGASALLMLAEAQRKDKKFAESNASLQVLVDKHSDHELVPNAKMAMAANLEAMGKIDESLALYKQIAATYPKTSTAPLAMLSQVPLLKGKNQTEEARRVCETVLAQYSDSYWASEAMRELRTFKPVAAAPSSAPGVPASIARPPAAAPPGPPSAVPPAPSAAPKPK